TTILMIFVIPIVIFSTTDVNAETGNHLIEKKYEFDCGMWIPGMDFETLGSIPFTIKISIPDTVGANQDFTLTNASVLMHFPYENSFNQDFPRMYNMGSPKFEIHSENINGTVTGFGLDSIMIEYIMPPYSKGFHDIFLTNEDGIEIGPFTAGQEGDVHLYIGTIDVEMREGFPWTLRCIPPENAILASISIDG